MASAHTPVRSRIEPTLYPAPPASPAVVGGSPAARRRRMAVERALRSDRSVGDRASDIVLELVPDVPGQDRTPARTRAAAVLAGLLAGRDIQTALELATAVQAHIETRAATAMDLYPMQGSLMLAVFSTRREAEFAAADRRVSRPFQYEAVAA